MNKYTDFIQECLETKYEFGSIFCKLSDKFNLKFKWGYDTKMSQLSLEHGDHKFTYLYLLSIVDQETADEMIELLKEPV